MLTYRHIRQERTDYCVPATLQMILARRGITPDLQEKIFAECGNKIHPNTALQFYFLRKQYPLNAMQFSVHESMTRDFDLLVQDGLAKDCDVIVAYAWEMLQGTPKPGNHVSLVTRLDKAGLTELIDPDRAQPVACSFSTLVLATFAANGGFHLVHPDLAVLEGLKKEYF